MRTLVGLSLNMYTLEVVFVASIATKEAFWLMGSSFGYIV